MSSHNFHICLLCHSLYLSSWADRIMVSDGWNLTVDCQIEDSVESWARLTKPSTFLPGSHNIQLCQQWQDTCSPILNRSKINRYFYRYTSFYLRAFTLASDHIAILSTDAYYTFSVYWQKSRAHLFLCYFCTFVLDLTFSSSTNNPVWVIASCVCLHAYISPKKMP